LHNVLLKHFTSKTIRLYYAVCLTGISVVVNASQSMHDNWQADGEHGQIMVVGLLSEGACHLELGSALQQIDLGTLSKTELSQPGNETAPVSFSLRLTDCYRSYKEQSIMPGSNELFSYIEPLVTLSFSGVADHDFPSLLNVNGVSGIALRISDKDRQTVGLNQAGRKYFISRKNEEFNYFVSAVRTSASVQYGEFWAVTNFSVNYE